VPVARVRGSGTEEGWYELRARDGELIMGRMFFQPFSVRSVAWHAGVRVCILATIACILRLCNLSGLRAHGCVRAVFRWQGQGDTFGQVSVFRAGRSGGVGPRKKEMEKTAAWQDDTAGRRS